MNSPELELIGIALNNKKLLPDIISIESSLFSDPFSCACQSSLKKMFNAGLEIDEYSLILDLINSGFGEHEAAEKIGDAICTVGDNQSYTTIKSYLEEQRNRKKIKRIIDDAAIRIEKGASFQSVNNFMIGAIISLAETSKSFTGFTSIKDASMKLAERLEQISKGQVKKIYTGLSALDKHLGGIEAPDVVYIAARPSMGKTSLGTRFINHIAESDKTKDNLIFSLETSDMRIAEKIHCQRSRIPQYKFNNCSLDQEDFDRLIKSIDDVSGSNNILINDRVDINENDVLAECIKHSYKKPVGSFMLDYLQLLKSPPGKWSREREVADQSAMMKLVAKELQCPAFILSQLNRGLENRQDKEPVMSDIRDSGSIEQDADIILFIYRPEVYDKDTDRKGQAKIIIAKNKRGKTGYVWVGWHGETMRFYDI